MIDTTVILVVAATALSGIAAGTGSASLPIPRTAEPLTWGRLCSGIPCLELAPLCLLLRQR
jgi:hypothetical protein